MDERRTTETPERLVRAAAEQPAISRALDWARDHADAFTEETIRIAEIPAPTGAEGERATYTAERFRALGLTDVAIDAVGNVYGRLAGRTRAGVALAAHLDTVFPASLSHTVERRNGRLYGPGIGDNSAGLSGLLGAVAAFQAGGGQPERSLWFVATVGEEGLGNLVGVRAATDRLGAELEGLLAIEGSFFGRLSHQAVGSRRFEINARAPGGHSWHDFGRPSATHLIARVAHAITELPVPSEPRTTFNIGKLEGGIGVNVIAEEARLVLDLRSVDPEALDDLTVRVQRLVAARSTQEAPVMARELGFRPAGAIAADHPLVQTCAAVLGHMGVTPQYGPASTDANIPLSRGIPAVTLGITRGAGAHTRAEWIETGPIVKGVQQLVLVAAALAGWQA